FAIKRECGTRVRRARGSAPQNGSRDRARGVRERRRASARAPYRGARTTRPSRSFFPSANPPAQITPTRTRFTLIPHTASVCHLLVTSWRGLCQRSDRRGFVPWARLRR